MHIYSYNYIHNSYPHLSYIYLSWTDASRSPVAAAAAGRRQRSRSCTLHTSNYYIKRRSRHNCARSIVRPDTRHDMYLIIYAVCCAVHAYCVRHTLSHDCVVRFLRHCALIHGTKPPNRTHALHTAYAAESRGAPTSSHSYPLLARTSKGAFKGCAHHRTPSHPPACASLLGFQLHKQSIASSAPSWLRHLTPQDTSQLPTSSPPKPPASA